MSSLCVCARVCMRVCVCVLKLYLLYDMSHIRLNRSDALCFPACTKLKLKQNHDTIERGLEEVTNKSGKEARGARWSGTEVKQKDTSTR